MAEPRRMSLTTARDMELMAPLLTAWRPRQNSSGPMEPARAIPTLDRT